MYDSGYLVPYIAEKFAAGSSNVSLISNIIISQFLPHQSNISTWTCQVYSAHIGLVILFVAIFILLLPPLVQTLISFFKWNHLIETKQSVRQRPCITTSLIMVIVIWFLLSVILLISVIILSENLNHTKSPNSDIINRVDDISRRSFQLFRTLLIEGKVIANDTLLGLTKDFYSDLLSEIPTITENFLNQTNLDEPLIILKDLSQTVEDLLNAHTYLREKGPQVALELEKLDSSMRVYGEMLFKEVQKTQRECLYRLPIVEEFDTIISELRKGLFNKSIHGDRFFNQFRLESSLGLFNMLTVLPFNVTEVMDQLNSAIRVRDDLGDSIQQNMETRFGQASDQIVEIIKSLSIYIEKALNKINETESTYHQTMLTVNAILHRFYGAWILVYIVGSLITIGPLVLLISSCFHPRQSVKIPVKEVFPLLTITETSSTSSSGCSASEDEEASNPESSLILPTQVERSSMSIDSDSGCPRSDSHAGNMWSRTSTLDKLDEVNIRRPGAAACQLDGRRRRRLKSCGHLTSCCGLLLLSLICIPLIFTIGYFHVHVSSY